MLKHVIDDQNGILVFEVRVSGVDVVFSFCPFKKRLGHIYHRVPG